MTAVQRLFAVAFLLLSGLAAWGGDWPQFRGTRGGVGDADDLPVRWTKDNFLWKVKLPGPGTSSPVTWGDRVFVTCYKGYGTTLTKGFGGFGKGGFGKGGFGKGGFGKDGPDSGGDQKNLRLMVLAWMPAAAPFTGKRSSSRSFPRPLSRAFSATTATPPAPR
jgi:hypothetical protein